MMILKSRRIVLLKWENGVRDRRTSRRFEATSESSKIVYIWFKYRAFWVFSSEDHEVSVRCRRRRIELELILTLNEWMIRNRMKTPSVRRTVTRWTRWISIFFFDYETWIDDERWSSFRFVLCWGQNNDSRSEDESSYARDRGATSNAQKSYV